MPYIQTRCELTKTPWLSGRVPNHSPMTPAVSVPVPMPRNATSVVTLVACTISKSANIHKRKETTTGITPSKCFHALYCPPQNCVCRVRYVFAVCLLHCQRGNLFHNLDCQGRKSPRGSSSASSFGLRPGQDGFLLTSCPTVEGFLGVCVRFS